MKTGYLRTETNFLVQKQEGVVLHVFQVWSVRITYVIHALHSAPRNTKYLDKVAFINFCTLHLKHKIFLRKPKYFSILISSIHTICTQKSDYTSNSSSNICATPALVVQESGTRR